MKGFSAPDIAKSPPGCTLPAITAGAMPLRAEFFFRKMTEIPKK
ncbi:hypothetical protein ATCR1_21210 [Agrobacterium tumefaciens CCNWGS0286]|nr:hypothetical protein ATCR1_21210 [Agrobacterium tumefaciens CCNWGS0286]EPR10074.1 hypothetical protein L902_15580 [Agrobacterium radiobacter DSM 30147]